MLPDEREMRTESAVIRVLIVTQVSIYCDSLAHAFRHDARFAVVGSVRTPFEAAHMLERGGPDIALVDTSSIDLDGALRVLRAVAPNLRVVALAVPETEDDVVACAEAGVSAIVTRDMSLTALMRTVECVESGELLCSPRVAASLLHRVQSLSHSAPAERLTCREREVLQLIDEEYSNKEIACALCIELGTVKNHVHSILRKLQVSRRSDAARWARFSTASRRVAR